MYNKNTSSKHNCITFAQNNLMHIFGAFNWGTEVSVYKWKRIDLYLNIQINHIILL